VTTELYESSQSNGWPGFLIGAGAALALRGGAYMVSVDAMLFFTGPVGWTIAGIGCIASSVMG